MLGIERIGGRGQASAEFAGVLPALVVAVLIAAQLAVAGYALWSAGVAARAGARAAHVGRDAATAAKRSLPPLLSQGARVNDSQGVLVRVMVPRLIPVLPRFSVRGHAALGGASG
jgi:uncharacterized protein (UPF0333 family)